MQAKNKKAVANIAILLGFLFLASITGGILYYGDYDFDFIGQTQFAIQTDGCVLAATDPTVELSGVSASSYTCTSDECLVKAYMNVEEQSEESKVVFRADRIEFDSGFIYTEINGVKSKWQKKPHGSLSTCGNGDILFVQNNPSYNVRMRDGDLCMIKDGSAKKYRLVENGITFNQDPALSCIGKEICDEEPQFKADWNFCRSDGRSYEYCDGSLEIANGEGPAYTDAESPRNIKIENKFGQSLTFNPIYPDGSPVTDKKLFIERYDCSCQDGLDDLNIALKPETCVAGANSQKYCKPTQNPTSCPSPFIKHSEGDRKYCYSTYPGSGLSGYQSGEFCYLTGVVSQYAYSCKQVTSISYNYDIFQSCDATAVVGSAGIQCPVFGSEGTCAQGSVCIVEETGQVGNGLGNCQCPTDTCSLNERIGTAGSDTYSECQTTISGCAQLVGNLQCDGDLVFDPDQLNELGTTGDCVCPTQNTATDEYCTDAGESPTCADSDTTKKCQVYEIIDGQTCEKYVETGCTGGSLETCSDGSCGCTGEYTNKCEFTGAYPTGDINVTLVEILIFLVKLIKDVLNIQQHQYLFLQDKNVLVEKKEN